MDLRLESVNSSPLAVLLRRCFVYPLFNSSDLDLYAKLKMSWGMASLMCASRGERTWRKLPKSFTIWLRFSLFLCLICRRHIRLAHALGRTTPDGLNTNVRFDLSPVPHCGEGSSPARNWCGSGQSRISSAGSLPRCLPNFSMRIFAITFVQSTDKPLDESLKSLFWQQLTLDAGR